MLAWCKIAACGTALAVRSKAPDATRDPESIEGVTRGALHLADQVSGADYLQSVNSIHSFGRQMAHLFEGFDVLVTPTLAEPPAAVGRFKPDNENFLDYRMGPTGILGYSPFAPLFNASGQPALSLPLHWTAEGLPVGVQFAAPFGADERLIALAAQIEEAADWRPQQQSLIARLMAVA
jgi:amidase/6-aminohexanoate-cyclic-dimer hydrolase